MDTLESCGSIDVDARRFKVSEEKKVDRKDLLAMLCIHT